MTGSSRVVSHCDPAVTSKANTDMLGKWDWCSPGMEDVIRDGQVGVVGSVTSGVYEVLLDYKPEAKKTVSVPNDHLSPVAPGLNPD